MSSPDWGGSSLSGRTLTFMKKQFSPLRGFVYLPPAAVFSLDLPVNSPQFWPGFFTYAQPRAQGSCPMGWIIL